VLRIFLNFLLFFSSVNYVGKLCKYLHWNLHWYSANHRPL